MGSRYVFELLNRPGDLMKWKKYKIKFNHASDTCLSRVKIFKWKYVFADEFCGGGDDEGVAGVVGAWEGGGHTYNCVMYIQQPNFSLEGIKRGFDSILTGLTLGYVDKLIF